MEILPYVSRQVAAVGLPLFAVSVTAVPHADTPVLLFLHWHGFRRSTPLRLAGVPLEPRAVPGSAVQLNERWQAIESIDFALLDAAWQMGASDVQRTEHRGCNDVAASVREAHECRQAFGDYPTMGAADEALLAEAPDREELMHLGARSGYVRWQFRPTRGGVWPRSEHDTTLRADGGREGPCPVLPERLRRRHGTAQSRHSYALGRCERILVTPH